MKTLRVLLGILVLLATNTHAQKFTKFIGDDDKNEVARSIIQHPSTGDYYVTGYAERTNRGTDAFLMKMNAAGDVQFVYYYGGDYDDEGQRLYFDDNDNSIIYIVGSAEYDLGQSKGAYVAKVSTSGILAWDIAVKGTTLPRAGFDLIQETNSLIILSQEGTSVNQDIDFAINRINKTTGFIQNTEGTDWDLVWGKTTANEGIAKILRLDTGNYVALGTWPINASNIKPTMIRVKDNLDGFINRKDLTIPESMDARFLNAIISDNDFLAAGYNIPNVGSSRAIVQEFTSAFTYSGVSFDLSSNSGRNLEAHHVLKIPGTNKYHVIGTSTSGSDRYTFFAKVQSNSSSTSLVWAKKLSRTESDNSEPKSGSVIPTIDGQYIYVGSATQDSATNTDMFIMKVGTYFGDNNCMLISDTDISVGTFTGTTLEKTPPHRHQDKDTEVFYDGEGATLDCVIECADFLQDVDWDPCDENRLIILGTLYIIEGAGVDPYSLTYQYQIYTNGQWVNVTSSGSNGEILVFEGGFPAGEHYRLIITTEDGCKIYKDLSFGSETPQAKTSSSNINPTWSNPKEAELHKVDLFPNPSTDEMTLDVSETPGVVSIIDMQGQIVETLNKIQTGQNTFDIKNLKGGMYLLRLEFPDGIKTISFVKQ